MLLQLGLLYAQPGVHHRAEAGAQHLLVDAGLPVGLQIVGRRWDDLTVLQAAAAYEHVALWQDRRPVYRYDHARTTDSALL